MSAHLQTWPVRGSAEDCGSKPGFHRQQCRCRERDQQSTFRIPTRARYSTRRPHKTTAKTTSRHSPSSYEYRWRTREGKKLPSPIGSGLALLTAYRGYRTAYKAGLTLATRSRAPSLCSMEVKLYALRTVRLRQSGGISF